MSLFNTVFDEKSIYNMLFFNVKGVLEHPTLELLKESNPEMFERWKYLSKTKYNVDFMCGDEELIKTTYEEKAVNYPEFIKVVAITYAKLYYENGKAKRYFKKISYPNEFDNIQTFMDILQGLSSDGIQSTPQYFPILCGYNIISHDIPLLIKKYLQYRKELSTITQIPFILKRTLDSKPWESVVVDVLNVWKFNGYSYVSLMLIADYMGLKKTQDLITHTELSKYYWDNYETDPDKTIEFVATQSANQTNLVIQLMNELRRR
ncbi:MAG: hypothetical protein ACOC22_00115 [bacterium]